MDRNSILGIILIAAIFVVMGVLNKPSKEELEQQKIRNDSIERAREVQTKLLEEKQTELEAVQQNIDSVKQEKIANRLGEFGATVSGENEFYTLENDLLELKISTKGGRPYSVKLKDYTTYDSMPLLLFNGDSTIFNLNFYKGNVAISSGNLYFKVDGNVKKHILVENQPETLSVKLMAADSGYMEYVYTVKPGSYEVGMDINFVGMENISGQLPNTLDLTWEIFSPRQEKGWKNESNYTTVYFKHKAEEDDVDFFRPMTKKDEQEETIDTKLEWIGYKDQFFASVIMADKAFNNAYIQSVAQEENSDYIKKFHSVIGLDYNSNTNTIPLSFYFGPNKFKLLKREFGDRRLHDMVSVGRNIIKWINQIVIINLFDWLSKGISNYGIIILLMTIIIKMLLLPLTFKSYMSQAKMRVVKPMVDEATKKIPKEKQMERQQATMAIYKKVGVSPMGGCLPMVLQMPILFAMFRFFPTSIELRHQGFLWATDLSTYDDLISWNTDIWLLGDHLSLFTVLMTVTTMLSMKINSGTQMSDQQMPGMKTMMYIMPVTFLFVLNNYSAGLTYYYCLANLITFGQNYLFKLFVDEEEVLKKLQAKKAKPKKKSKWQQRIEDMQRMQQQQVKKRK
jgi:YidC/Oxa1 family membrane protein insertase